MACNENSDDCEGCAAYDRLFADLFDLSPCEPTHALEIRPLMAAFHGNGDERAWLEIVSQISAIARAADKRTTPSPALRRVRGFLAESLDLVPERDAAANVSRGIIRVR